LVHHCTIVWYGHAKMNKLSPNMGASLATDGHVYCAGTLAQCLHRWKKLSDDKKASAFLKIAAPGYAPVRGEALRDMALNPQLNDAWLR